MGEFMMVTGKSFRHFSLNLFMMNKHSKNKSHQMLKMPLTYVQKTKVVFKFTDHQIDVID